MDAEEAKTASIDTLTHHAFYGNEYTINHRHNQAVRSSRQEIERRLKKLKRLENKKKT